MATLRQLLESLSTTQIQGQVPKEIRASLVEQNRQLNPLYGLLARFAVETNVYYWNTRTALPQGGPSLEAPPTSPGTAGYVAASSSAYTNNNSVNIRNLTFKGDVSKIAEQVATKNGSVIANEIKGQAESERRIETILNLYGSEHATANSNKIQWSGFDQQVAKVNKVGGASAGVGYGAVATAGLDDLYDIIRSAVGQESLGGDWMYVMSPSMQTAVNQLYSNTNRTNLPVETFAPRIDPDIFGQRDADFYAQAVRAMAGVEILTYRGCPLVPSGQIQPTGQMGTVTIGAGGASGTTFTAAAQYYRVEAVTVLGKTVASAEVTYTPTAGGSIQLSWSTPMITDRYGNPYPVLLYRVFRGAASGTATLYAIVGGYDGNDNLVTSFTDTNAAIDPLNGGAGTAYVFAAPDGVTVPATTAKTEDIFLIPRDPDIAGMAVLNEMRTEQLAPVSSRSVQFETTADMAWTVFTGGYCAQLVGVTHS